MLWLVRRRRGNWRFVVSSYALLNDMLQACQGAHNYVPMLADNINSVIDMTAQRRRDKRITPQIGIDKCPACTPVGVE